MIFLKDISDAFEAKHAELETATSKGADPEDPDEYRATSIFWVPKEARWAHLKASAPQPTIGSIIDEAMTAIERDNPSLKGVLPKDFGRPNLDKIALGRLINLASDIALGSDEAHSGKIGDISIYGQESNYTTWRLAKMNLAIRGSTRRSCTATRSHNDGIRTSRPTMCWRTRHSTTATGAATC